ncbi:Postacrosomal sheath WW domain-binding protein [Porphyridium purpureum]|uniref:Postacrosomal sheath WW domain-binding protein n=1 Tax=Porphyridium purpureum TaxID=35688 RepID=A0A5J4Z7M4_PORPP|nr:Postacrosomal sheath WW domain-binding protein [Porphyridium purpureum]|eukprot:POR6991..scf295_1
MALNVPTVVDSSGRVLPQPFPGEVFMLQRSKVECELKDATGKWKSVKGELYLTSLRLAFVTDPKELPKSRFISIEFPLQGIWDEALNQPIFGCNNVSGTSQYYEDQPFDGTLMFKLYFLHGGVGTFVPRLNFALQQVRASMQQSGQVYTDSPVISAGSLDDLQRSAFVDPSDPSVVYTMSNQPRVPNTGHVSRANLRQRR